MCRAQIDTERAACNGETPGNRMRYELYMELREMASRQGRLPCEEPFSTLYRRAERALKHIDMLLHHRLIEPRSALRTRPGQPEPPQRECAVRIGVYPVAANPLHWAHVLIGLEAMAKLRLDRIIYIIAGHDARKPDLINAQLRYSIAHTVLAMFDPYLCCSDIALDTDLDGETNLVRLLQLNRQQRIHACYLAGADHYRRAYPEGYPDTIAKLERCAHDGLFNSESARHTVRAAFIMRGHLSAPLQTCIPSCFLDGMPGNISSTLIRQALRGRAPAGALAFLPHSAYMALRESNAYPAVLPRRVAPGIGCREAAVCI